MVVNLFGNINDIYQKQNIDLLEMAKKQNRQPVQFCDREVGMNTPVIKIDISEEGLRALHGSELKGATDLEKMREEICFISKHQPIESFTNRFSRVLRNSYLQISGQNSDVENLIQEKADAILGEYESIYDEIVSGYEDGSRVRFIEDTTSADGYRELTKDDELSILLSEFGEIVEKRFGKQHQEESVKVAAIVNDLQKVKQEVGRGDIRYYEPEYIPDGFAEKLMKAASEYRKV